MYEQQRDGVFVGARLVQEMHIHGIEAVNIDGSAVVWQAIELCFRLLPVVPGLPVLDQSLDVCKR